jgi:hypothetical protein
MPGHSDKRCLATESAKSPDLWQPDGMYWRRLTMAAFGFLLLTATTGFTLPGPGGRPVPPAGAWQSPERFGAVLGRSGPIRTFAVAVESGVPVGVAAFTDLVEATLGDPRGWTADGQVRLQRVPGTAGPNFTIFLAVPQTAAALCRGGGVDIRLGGVPYTSCRAGSNVVLNTARYLDGVPNYGASIEDYRRYVVNHEVGHWLGYGHERCPGPGQPAPVMSQQTLGLQGCVANSWPLRDGLPYHGPPAA